MTIITDLDRSSLLELVDSHKSDDIAEFVRAGFPPMERTQAIAVLKQQPLVNELKEELIGIYNSNITSRGGKRKINKWLKSAKIMFSNAANTIDSHLEGICNYFNNRTTSGVTEGINTKIKLIIRQSYGFKNFERMKQKLLACLSPY